MAFFLLSPPREFWLRRRISELSNSQIPPPPPPSSAAVVKVAGKGEKKVSSGGEESRKKGREMPGQTFLSATTPSEPTVLLAGLSACRILLRGWRKKIPRLDRHTRVKREFLKTSSCCNFIFLEKCFTLKTCSQILRLSFLSTRSSFRNRNRSCSDAKICFDIHARLQ